MTPKERFFTPFAALRHPERDQIVSSTLDSEGKRLREFLARTSADDLRASDIGSELEGRLSRLTPEAFRYFLPAFLHASLESYASISVFVSELVSALTQPSRADVEETYERTASIEPGIGLPAETTELLRRQQLDWFDSGTPLATFHERVIVLTPAEGAAVHAFFEALEQAHGEDFPFGELQSAVGRYWVRFATA